MLNIQYLFFIISVLLTLTLLFIKKRKIDFLTIYVLVLFLYSTPLLFNKVFVHETFLFTTPVLDMFVVMAIPFLGASLGLIVSKNNYYYYPKPPSLTDKASLYILLIATFISFSLFLPILLSSSDKGELFENTNIVLYTLYSYLPVAGFLISFKIKNKRFLIIFGCILFFMLLFGARRSVATAVLASLLISMQNIPLRLVSKYKIILGGAFVLVTLILSKSFYGFALYYGPLLGFQEWIQNFEFKFLISGSEFIAQSAILNAVLKYDFHADKFHFLYSVLALQPIPLSFFGLSSSYFNDQYQHVLFPGIRYGMASNIWADAYAAFGYYGVLTLSIIIPLLLSSFWSLYYRSKNFISVVLLIVGITFAFWVHRNSLSAILASIRNIFYPLFFIYLAAMFTAQFLKKR